MPRNSTSQTKHDRMVRSEANKLEDQGFKVKADIADYPKPDTIRGYRPDVVGRKGSERKIIEVETPESLQRDKRQQATFRRHAGQKPNTTFEVRKTE